MTTPVDTRQVIERVNRILTTFKRIDPQVLDVLHQATAMAAELVIARAKLGRLQPASSTELEVAKAPAAAPIHTPGFRKVDFAGEYLEQTSGRATPADLLARRAAQPLACAIPAATPHDPGQDASAKREAAKIRQQKKRARDRQARMVPAGQEVPQDGIEKRNTID
jgi:hypothetical protein